MKSKVLWLLGAVVVLVLLWQSAIAQGVPFSGTFNLGGDAYEFNGEAVLVAAAAPPTGAVPYTESGIGGHGWGYALGALTSVTQTNSLIGVNIPSQMRQAGFDWPDLVNAAGYAGPSHSISHQYATQNGGLGANALIYVPEGRTTAGNVPISETVNLTPYLDSLVETAVEFGYVPVYGPSLEMISDPATMAATMTCAARW